MELGAELMMLLNRCSVSLKDRQAVANILLRPIIHTVADKRPDKDSEVKLAGSRDACLPMEKGVCR